MVVSMHGLHIVKLRFLLSYTSQTGGIHMDKTEKRQVESELILIMKWPHTQQMVLTAVLHSESDSSIRLRDHEVTQPTVALNGKRPR